MKGDGYLDFEEIVPLCFIAQSPVEGHTEELFDLREEISLGIPGMATERLALPPPVLQAQVIPEAIPEATHKFDIEFVQEYFTFDNDDQIATLVKG